MIETKIIHLEDLETPPWDEPTKNFRGEPRAESNEATFSRLRNEGWTLVTVVGREGNIFVFEREITNGNTAERQGTDGPKADIAGPAKDGSGSNNDVPERPAVVTNRPSLFGLGRKR